MIILVGDEEVKKIQAKVKEQQASSYRLSAAKKTIVQKRVSERGKETGKQTHGNSVFHEQTEIRYVPIHEAVK